MVLPDVEDRLKLFSIIKAEAPRSVRAKPPQKIRESIMLNIRRWLASGLLFFALITPACAQGYGIGTPVEAKRMVEQAVDYLRANGEEKTLQEFSKRNGRFQWRDLYAFAYDLDGVMRSHPDAHLIGLNLLDTPDSRGKLFRKDIVEIASTRGSAWVDYTYSNPRTKVDDTKITYCAREGSLIICCGAYLP